MTIGAILKFQGYKVRYFCNRDKKMIPFPKAVNYCIKKSCGSCLSWFNNYHPLKNKNEKPKTIRNKYD